MANTKSTKTTKAAPKKAAVKPEPSAKIGGFEVSGDVNVDELEEAKKAIEEKEKEDVVEETVEKVSDVVEHEPAAEPDVVEEKEEKGDDVTEGVEKSDLEDLAKKDDKEGEEADEEEEFLYEAVKLDPVDEPKVEVVETMATLAKKDAEKFNKGDDVYHPTPAFVKPRYDGAVAAQRLW